MENNTFDDNSDREIVQRVLAGSSEDFQLIISKYKDLIFSLVFRSIRNQEDAEDLVQDIFYRLFLNLKKYNLQKKFYTWMYTLAINLIRNRLKRDQKSSSLFVAPLAENELVHKEVGSENGLETQVVLEEEIRDQVQVVLNKMKDKYRLVLVMYYFENLSVRDIGTILGIPQNSVKTRLKRARELALEIIKRSKKSETFFNEICKF